MVYHYIRKRLFRKRLFTEIWLRCNSLIENPNWPCCAAYAKNQRTIDFFEIKSNAVRFDEALLRRKAEEFLTVAGEFASYKQSFTGLSLKDM